MNGADWKIVLKNSDEELWALARDVFDRHGRAGSSYIAREMADAAIAGMHESVSVWLSVSKRFTMLSDGSGKRP